MKDAFYRGDVPSEDEAVAIVASLRAYFRNQGRWLRGGEPLGEIWAKAGRLEALGIPLTREAVGQRSWFSPLPTSSPTRKRKPDVL